MAYEIKKLVEKFKEKGLDVVEETAIESIKAVSEWAQEEAKKGESPLADALVLIAAPQLEKVFVGLADKIDGKQEI